MKKEEREDKPDVAEEVSEKELLKQAEEREKERKAEEEEIKKAQKEEEKKKKTEKKEEKTLHKVSVRRRPRHGKKYREIASKIENKEYGLDEAINLALESNPSKFDATIELHVKLNAREKNIRGMVFLPGGITKEKKIKEVTLENIDNVVAQIKAGKIDFDIMIADVKAMPKLAQLAKVLGPKGLMPSPKAGTVVEDTKKAIEELKGGKVEFRADKANIVHMAIGKISFGFEKVKQNYQAVVDHLPKRIDSIHLSTSMGPGIKVGK